MSSSSVDSSTSSDARPLIHLSINQIVSELKSSKDPKILLEAEKRWTKLKELYGTEYVTLAFFESSDNEDQAILFQICLENLSHRAKTVLSQNILMSWGVEMLKILAQKPSSSLTTCVIDLLLMQLIEPINPQAKVVTQEMLQSCALHVSDAIRMLFYEVMVSGATSNCGADSSKSDVYSVMYELLLIDKSLTTGLINYCELCLLPSREDRLAGVQFLCKLFTEKYFPGLPDPASFYSHLWEEFIHQYTSFMASDELNILLDFTPLILRRHSLQKDWCTVLLSRIELEHREQLEMALVKSILKAVVPDAQILVDGDTIFIFLETLLNRCRGVDWKLRNLAWEYLYKGLGKLYRSLASQLLNVFNPELRDKASVVIQLLLGLCSELDTSNENWSWVLRVFCKSCLLHNRGTHMKMLLLSWILSKDQVHVLHRLFFRTKNTSLYLKSLLAALKDQRRSPMSVKQAACKLLLYLPYQRKGKDFIFLELVESLKANAELINLFLEVTINDLAFEEKFNVLSFLCKSIVFKNKVEEKIMFSLCYSLLLAKCDEVSFEDLLFNVDMYIYDETVARCYGLSGIQLANLCLQLVHELLFLSPTLGLSVTVMRYLLKWSRLTVEKVSCSVLRCFWTAARFGKLVPRTDAVIVEFDECLMRDVQKGTRRKVKMAIRCLLSNPSHPSVAISVFKIIQQRLFDNSSMDHLLCGISALGFFAPFCPPHLKNELESHAMDTILKFVSEAYLQLPKPPSSDSDESNSFEWELFPYQSRLLVAAFRSLGKCLRYCGSKENASIVFQLIESILKESPYRSCGYFTNVEIDCFHLEAACVVLTLLECHDFHPLISKELILLMSALLTDSCRPVKIKFADKLCQGLKPLKVHFSERGKSRGQLPFILLGFLPLLGLNTAEGANSEDIWFEKLVEQVFLSRSRALNFLWRSSDEPLWIIHRKYCDLLPANVLIHAIPIIAAQTFIKTSDPPEEDVSFSSVTVSGESLMQVAQCFAFIIAKLQSSMNSFQCTKEYLSQIIERARNVLLRSSDDLFFKKCLAVWEVLDFVANHYNPRHAFKLKAVALDGRFFGHVEHPRIGFAKQLTEKLKEDIRHKIFQYFIQDTYDDIQSIEDDFEYEDDVQPAAFEEEAMGVSALSASPPSLFFQGPQAQSTPITDSDFRVFDS